MRKIHIALLGIFVFGVLLGGIGTGIAFGEYSAFDYEGKVLLGEDKLVTKSFEYTFEPESEGNIILSDCFWGDWEKDSLVVEDQSIPVGVVRYQVTYNKDMVRPELIFWKMTEAEKDENTAEEQESVQEKKREKTVLELRCFTQQDDFAIMMEHKDRILEDLKNKKIAEYEAVSVTDVSVHVNPDTLPYLTDETRKDY